MIQQILVSSLALLFIPISAANSKKCPQYVCSDNEVSNDVCAYKLRTLDFDEKIYITSCKPGFSCPIEDIKNSDVTQVKCKPTDKKLLLDYNHYENEYHLISSRMLNSELSFEHPLLSQSNSKTYLPGEACTQNSDCFSNTCTTSGVCNGKKQDEVCDYATNEDIECDVGYYCNKDKKSCQKQVEVGEACSDTIKCVNWGVCNKGTCYQRRSLNASAEIEGPKYRDVCYNFYAVTEEDGKTYCSPGPYLNNSHVCKNIDDKCYYFRLGNEEGTSHTVTESADCQCGYGQKGNAYCPFKEGDEQFTKTLDLAYNFWIRKPKCHISNPPGCQEAKNTKGYYTIVGSRLELLYGHELMDNSECFKQVGKHNRYWNEVRTKMADEIQKERDDDAAVLNLGLSILSLVGIIVMNV
ncbi:UNKNOWN [Stylonychia lemnae]|uniref:Dickkopf N-terminal cysteine-rich domain-containing protein n=1 Tax=Stylonychia lemnae TaxID=5949 RepID=A0A078B1K7_STYLE|nr:UNKNOWN [Stylonychia lemnae]|eukprot:CDW88191.1 UNKNOWN [Stylonychia lemnae]